MRTGTAVRMARDAAARSPGARYGALAGGLGPVALAFRPAGRFVELYGPQRLLVVARPRGGPGLPVRLVVPA